MIRLLSAAALSTAILASSVIAFALDGGVPPGEACLIQHGNMATLAGMCKETTMACIGGFSSSLPPSLNPIEHNCIEGDCCMNIDQCSALGLQLETESTCVSTRNDCPDNHQHLFEAGCTSTLPWCCILPIPEDKQDGGTGDGGNEDGGGPDDLDANVDTDNDTATDTDTDTTGNGDGGNASLDNGKTMPLRRTSSCGCEKVGLTTAPNLFRVVLSTLFNQ